MPDFPDDGRSDAPAAAAASAPYRVLARKYRPSTFDDLIGQEAMTRTLANAFELGRIHQAYMLTGVRGVGKTTTARILARAFNYERPAAEGRPAVLAPTIHMDGPGVHCQAIMESRHVDVIEMDAASHTGIDDVREIIEGARYKPVMARFKVYIIDEVHMLSKQAFNGLLKTLEEPPDHVKFLFATTEIEKVPVTVRSRCQRFDLRRIEAGALAAHLARICAAEQTAAEPEALALIARAAEGSARDALSLLDQAIAHGAPGAGAAVTAEDMRLMLGLADRGRIVDLFGHLVSGEPGAALSGLRELYDGGADPAAVVLELAEFVHLVTRLKILPAAGEDASLAPLERARGAELAATLSMAVLTRAWQLLSKALQEVRDSPRPLAAAEMALVRLAYAADLPTPDEALRRLAAAGEAQAFSPAGSSPSSSRETAGRGSAARLAAAPAEKPAYAGPSAILAAGPSAALAPAASPREAAPESALRLSSFAEVVALAASRRDIQLKLALERDVRLVRFDDGSLEFAPGPEASPLLAQTLARKLQEWTGRRWMVALSGAPGRPTLKEEADARAKDAMRGVLADPAVRRTMELFPGAEIVAVRAKDEAGAGVEPQPEAMDDDAGFDEDGYFELDF